METTTEMYGKFAEFFSRGNQNSNNKYVMIGGTALNLLSNEAGYENTRSTKDFDIVLLIDDIDGNKEFYERLWKYIEEGNYDVWQNKEGESNYFRFKNTDNTVEFPNQLEFFAKKPDFIKGYESRLTPLHLDDEISSLSAIIMDEEYFNFLSERNKVVNDIVCIDEIGLIALKIKAYIDKMNKKEMGEEASKREINKHKNDVLRILEFIPRNQTISLEKYKSIKDDVENFLKYVNSFEEIITFGERGKIEKNVISSQIKEIFNLE